MSDNLEFKDNDIPVISREQTNQLIVDGLNLQREILDKAKKQLPREFKKRATQLANQCKEFNVRVLNGEVIDSDEKLMELCEHAFKPIINSNGTMMTYNFNEIAVGFDYYRKIVIEINKNGEFYVPTREDFCRLMGISTATFLSYKTSNSVEMREVCTMIEDYLASIYTQLGLKGKIEKLTGMFYQKSALGRKETSVEQTPQQVTNNIVIGDSELKEMLKNII